MDFAVATFSVAFGELFKDLISPHVQRLLFGGEVPLFGGEDPQLLDDMRGVLLTAKAVLDDAEKKQIINPSVTNWVNDLKDAAYQVEDLVDEAETKLSEQELVKGKTTMEHYQANKENLLKKMVGKLKNLARGKDLLKLNASVIQPPIMYPTTSLPDESEVIGRDKDIKELKKSLLAVNAQQNKIHVIAIVGLGGVGKTRLAQLLWEEVQKEEFQLKAWANVSKGSDVVDVLIMIMQSFNLSESEVRNPNILQLRLAKALEGQKFLLVLDNIWDDDYLNCWELLSTPLRAGKSGSRIIVTTRNQNVASKMGADVTYPLLPLSFEACLSLFEKHAFQDNPKDHPGLKKIGEKIVKKCNGLPLAAKTLGGILRPKSKDEEWREILDSKIWHAAYSNILPALILSYYDLPGHLKKCFAYCSIFPKGYEIEKDKLVLLWMAQGFLEKTNSNDTMEKVGEEYGRELLSRSLFQSSGNGSCYVMHDLINDLAQFASGEFCCKFENSKTHVNWEKARHFAFLMERFAGPDKFVEITTTPLRTFFPVSFSIPSPRFCFNTIDNWALLEKMKRLRVLSFSCYAIYYLPESLGHLIHLRYLDFSHTLIAKVPDSACSLYNLQTLLLSSCPNLIALPANIGDLTNLRHLDVSETSKLTEMPSGIERLTSLQVLINFVASNGSGSKMGELFKLSHLCMLSISRMEKIVDAKIASEANLGSKCHLKELGFKWGSDTGDIQNAQEVLKNLRPHKNLKKLTIENYGGTAFPNWLGDAVFSNMVSLTLLDCKYCVSLPSLGKLSSLQELYIKNMAGLERLGNEFNGNNNFESRPFRSLKTLQFENLEKWEHWESFPNEDEAFPSLQELHIKDCPKLTPSIPGNLHSLKKLKVIGCKKIETLPVGSFTKLQFLYIEDCKDLSSLSIRDEVLTFFLEMEIKNCPNLKSLPYVRLSTCLPCLQKLELSKCPELSQISECNLPPNLKSLIIINCNNLKPQKDWGLLQMKWLTHFEIEGGCRNMSSLPEEGLLPITLTSLRLSNLPDLKNLGSGLKHLKSLEKLIINCCANLGSMVAGDLPPDLQSLTIMNCNKLIPSTNWELNKMKSLFTFEIDGGCGSMDSFPQEDLLPPNLTSLRISNLPDLKVLGNGLHQLIWLANLKINDCENLSMPAEKIRAFLDSLDIQNCPGLLKSLWTTSVP